MEAQIINKEELIGSDTKNDEQGLSLLNILVIVLSVYVLTALIVDTAFVLPPETSRLLNLVDNVICGFFFYDFCLRFYKAESKLKFMRWGWIDLISCIPTMDFLRAGRALRLIRLLRVLRAFRSIKNIINHLFKDRIQGTFSMVAVIAVLMIIFSAITILQFEDQPNSNIKSAEDALWWAYVTITTVGYGDKYPVTTEGRMIAAVLMTVGVGLFGTLSGFLSSWFLKDKKPNNE